MGISWIGIVISKVHILNSVIGNHFCLMEVSKTPIQEILPDKADS
jgi:hypothetical protein